MGHKDSKGAGKGGTVVTEEKKEGSSILDDIANSHTEGGTSAANITGQVNMSAPSAEETGWKEWVDPVTGEVYQVSTDTGLTDAGFMLTEIGARLVGTFVGKENIPSSYGAKGQDIMIFDAKVWTPVPEDFPNAKEGSDGRFWLVKEGMVKVGVTSRLERLAANSTNIGERFMLTVMSRERDTTKKHPVTGKEETRSGAINWDVRPIQKGVARDKVVADKDAADKAADSAS